MDKCPYFRKIFKYFKADIVLMCLKLQLFSRREEQEKSHKLRLNLPPFLKKLLFFIYLVLAKRLLISSILCTVIEGKSDSLGLKVTLDLQKVLLLICDPGFDLVLRHASENGLMEAAEPT